METFNVTKNMLLCDNKQFLIAEAEIKNFLIISEDKLIILLLDFDHLQSDRNIFCYGFDQKLKWKIPQPDKLHSDNYYTSVYLSDGVLYAYNINGVEVAINKYNG
ncbi:MAG TPA: hypothetical protein PLS50_07880, partial [Candidatus Dojkabacteria bacterium]|nr:hypothetical protein [Candidatus Dojkabacteria bacterium]